MKTRNSSLNKHFRLIRNSKPPFMSTPNRELPTALPSDDRRTLFGLIFLAVAIAGLFDVALHRILFASPLHDQAWLLYAADRFLHGTRLYGPRLVETNPPLIIWLSTLPAWLADHLHLDPLLVLHALVTLLLALSSAWSVRILRAAGVLRSRPATIATFALLLVVQTWVNPVDFAEREHLLILLLFPYLLASCFQLGARLRLPERLALGLLAGLGLCIKPQQALIVLGTEIFLALWYRQIRRLVRPELLILVLTGLGYIAAVALFAPLYFTQIVPILRDTYWAFRIHPALWVMLHGLAYDLLLPATALAWFLARRRLRYPVAPITLLVASFFASIGFSMQHAGWVYQAIPRKVFLLAAVFWLASEWLAPHIARLHPGHHLRLLTTTTLLVIIIPTTLFALQLRRQSLAPHPQTFEQQVYATLPPGTTVYVLSTDFFGFADVLHDHLRWGGRYVHLWMLPAIILSETATAAQPAAVTLPTARVQQLATLLRTNVADDLHTFAPSIVLVARCTPTHPCQALNGLSFDTLAWFQRSPGFATEWLHYRLQQSSPDFNVYIRIP
jgi:uncharacterized membrane protein